MSPLESDVMSIQALATFAAALTTNSADAKTPLEKFVAQAYDDEQREVIFAEVIDGLEYRQRAIEAGARLGARERAKRGG